ncbi:MAG: glycosyltransferase family 2 protein [Janthinobacterium lividum]
MSQSSLDVSVVIPTCNRAALVTEAVKSVLSQTRQPREIIVVDNGTDSSTEEALGCFANVLTYIRQPPIGVQAARNVGVAAASSTWVATLDDDDLYQTEFLSTAEAIMIDNRADAIFSDHRKFCGSVQEKKTNFEMAPDSFWAGIPGPEIDEDWSFIGRFPLEKILNFVPFYPSTAIMKRSLYQQIGGYDPQVRGIKAEDIEFLIRLLAVAKLAIIWKPLVDYRLHELNDSGNRLLTKVGRFTVFTYLQRKADVLPTGFMATLQDDLRQRPAEIFDYAFVLRDFPIMRDIALHMHPEDWSKRRKLLKLLSHIPQPLQSFSLRSYAVIQRARRQTGIVIPQGQ